MVIDMTRVYGTGLSMIDWISKFGYHDFQVFHDCQLRIEKTNGKSINEKAQAVIVCTYDSIGQEHSHASGMSGISGDSPMMWSISVSPDLSLEEANKLLKDRPEFPLWSVEWGKTITYENHTLRLNSENYRPELYNIFDEFYNILKEYSIKKRSEYTRLERKEFFINDEKHEYDIIHKKVNLTGEIVQRQKAFFVFNNGVCSHHYNAWAIFG